MSSFIAAGHPNLHQIQGGPQPTTKPIADSRTNSLASWINTPSANVNEVMGMSYPQSSLGMLLDPTANPSKETPPTSLPLANHTNPPMHQLVTSDPGISPFGTISTTRGYGSTLDAEIGASPRFAARYPATQNVDGMMMERAISASNGEQGKAAKSTTASRPQTGYKPLHAQQGSISQKGKQPEVKPTPKPNQRPAQSSPHTQIPTEIGSLIIKSSMTVKPGSVPGYYILVTSLVYGPEIGPCSLRVVVAINPADKMNADLYGKRLVYLLEGLTREFRAKITIPMLSLISRMLARQGYGIDRLQMEKWLLWRNELPIPSTKGWIIGLYQPNNVRQAMDEDVKTLRLIDKYETADGNCQDGNYYYFDVSGLEASGPESGTQRWMRSNIACYWFRDSQNSSFRFLFEDKRGGPVRCTIDMDLIEGITLGPADSAHTQSKGMGSASRTGVDGGSNKIVVTFSTDECPRTERYFGRETEFSLAKGGTVALQVCNPLREYRITADDAFYYQLYAILADSKYPGKIISTDKQLGTRLGFRQKVAHPPAERSTAAEKRQKTNHTTHQAGSQDAIPLPLSPQPTSGTQSRQSSLLSEAHAGVDATTAIQGGATQTHGQYAIPAGKVQAVLKQLENGQAPPLTLCQPAVFPNRALAYFRSEMINPYYQLTNIRPYTERDNYQPDPFKNQRCDRNSEHKPARAEPLHHEQNFPNRKMGFGSYGPMGRLSEDHHTLLNDTGGIKQDDRNVTRFEASDRARLMKREHRVRKRLWRFDGKGERRFDGETGQVTIGQLETLAVASKEQEAEESTHPPVEAGMIQDEPTPLIQDKADTLRPPVGYSSGLSYYVVKLDGDHLPPKKDLPSFNHQQRGLKRKYDEAQLESSNTGGEIDIHVPVKAGEGQGEQKSYDIFDYLPPLPLIPHTEHILPIRTHNRYQNDHLAPVLDISQTRDQPTLADMFGTETEDKNKNKNENIDDIDSKLEDNDDKSDDKPELTAEATASAERVVEVTDKPDPALEQEDDPLTKTDRADDAQSEGQADKLESSPMVMAMTADHISGMEVDKMSSSGQESDKPQQVDSSASQC